MAKTVQQSGRVTAGVSFAARLAFESICHRYGPDSETLVDVSLTAEPGEVLCLLGPSGSGKTTLLRIAAGIEAQTSGRVLLNDREIAGPSVFLPPERRSIGLVFQDFALFPHMSILDNVRFGLTALSRSEALREAQQSLRRVRLEGMRRRFRMSCRVVNSNAWHWRGRLRRARPFSSWTSRSPVSTPGSRTACGPRRCRSCDRVARQQSSSLTMRKRPCAWRTGSRF